MKIHSYSILILVCFVFACNTTQKVRTGQMAFELKQFELATNLYPEDINKAKESSLKASYSYNLAESYRILGDHNVALKWYSKALSYQENRKYLSAYAYGLKRTEKYEEATNVFRELYSIDQDNVFKKEIANCEAAQDWKKLLKDRFTITSLQSNSEFNDYGAVLYEDEYLVFSSDRLSSIGNSVYNWTGKDFSDLFVMSKTGASIYNFEAILNSTSNEGAACFSQDYNEIYFTRCEAITLSDSHCRIYYSNRFEGSWIEPRPLLFFEESTNYGQAALIENDSVLIFSVQTDAYLNSHDLFYAVKLEDGWSQPESMPGYINTDKDELFPTTYGDTLFFASEGHPGMGGLDIFKTYLRSDNSWAVPENLKYPINSGADDFHFTIDPKKSQSGLRSGFLSSNRNGDDDIFKFQEKFIRKTEKDEIDIDQEVEDPIENTIYLVVKVVELVRENDDPNEKVIEKRPMPDANLKLIDEGKSTSLELDQQGTLIQEISANKNIKLKAEKVGFLANVDFVSTEQLDFSNTKSMTINVELGLEKIRYDQEIILEDIYYDFDKWDIRDDAGIVLDSLYTILTENPLINIELGSHTDCRGPDEYNLDLSENRARSAVNYLISKGISNRRLSAKGFGENVAIASCICDECSEEEHQRNRRTSFKIKPK